ncbi:CD209 antigen-like protein A isoform X2 [Anarhichas minor]|uniref:CD209 antigen-like protein A isoform X2 n=1 Tax=Anarhichas minor TaxID=65739 RepID=UPI003F7384CE
MSVVYCIDDCVHWSSLCSGPRSSKLKSRSDGAVFLCLGLLSVFLLARLISFFVYYRASEDKLSSVSEERDLLNASLTNLTKEMNRLQRLCNQKKTCPEGWRRFSCSCYLLSTRTDSWEESRKDCRDKGADLVIIDSLEVQKFISSIVTDRTWIGLSDRDEEGTWKWVDGTPLTEAYWHAPPDNGGDNPPLGEEDCVEIINDPGRKWNDLRCHRSLQWICEKLP